MYIFHLQESLTSLLSSEGPVDVEDLVSKLRTIISENLELKGKNFIIVHV